MSGTSHFRDAGQPRGARGGRLGAWSLTAREHLGDRLAAYVDCELDGDARERVLSHLAACTPCRGEAEEQRRLKSAMADALPPALSAGLLARLQCLPGCAPDDLSGPGPDTPFGLFGSAGRPAPGGLPGGDRASFLTPAAGAAFPVHEIGRPASRGRRLAFAAAGAFSLAALAMGAALPLESVPVARGGAEPATGSAGTPLSMQQVADRRAAGPSPAPAVAERPTGAGGRHAFGVTGSAASPPPGTPGACTPGPSALPLAPWTVEAAASAAPAPQPRDTPPHPRAAAPRTAAAPAASASAPAAPAVPTAPPVAAARVPGSPQPLTAGVPHLPRPPIGGPSS